MTGNGNATGTVRLVEVEVFSDFCCPWCLIGVKHLDDAIAVLADQVDVRIVFRPFELDPAAPEGGVNIKAKLLEKHGVRAEQVFPVINARARESGIPLELERQPFAYPTAAAHTLVRHAAAKGTARALSRAIAEAYFLDAVSIADPAILAKLASQYGFAREEALALLSDAGELAQTRAEAHQSAQRGIRSVPTIIIGGVHTMSPSQPVAELKKALTDHAC